MTKLRTWVPNPLADRQIPWATHLKVHGSLVLPKATYQMSDPFLGTGGRGR